MLPVKLVCRFYFYPSTLFLGRQIRSLVARQPKQSDMEVIDHHLCTVYWWNQVLHENWSERTNRFGVSDFIGCLDFVDIVANVLLPFLGSTVSAHVICRVISAMVERV